MLTVIEKMMILSEFRSKAIIPNTEKARLDLIESLQLDLLDHGFRFERLCEQAGYNHYLETNSIYDG